MNNINMTDIGDRINEASSNMEKVESVSPLPHKI